MKDKRCKCAKSAKVMYRIKGEREFVYSCEECLPKEYRKLAYLYYSIIGFKEV